MYDTWTFVPFCKMKISRSSRTTAKKPTATHRPLILVRLIFRVAVGGGAVWGGALWGGAAGAGGLSGTGSGDTWIPGCATSAAGAEAGVGVGVGWGSVLM